MQSIENSQKFECFPDLPLEIQRMIWKAALPGPRMIKVELAYTTKMAKKNNGKSRKTKVGRFKADVEAPAGLRVCRDSRTEALKEYQTAFPTRTAPAQIYVNYDIDTILFGYSNYFPLPFDPIVHSPAKTKKYKPLLHNEFENVKYLAIYDDFIYTGCDIQRCNFPQLEKVIVLFPSVEYFWTSKEKKNGNVIKEIERKICEVDFVHEHWLNQIADSTTVEDPITISHGRLLPSTLHTPKVEVSPDGKSYCWA